jgi:DNA-binding SARP family transcriptional activator
MRKVIETSPAGYRLALMPQRVDASYFVELVARADGIHHDNPRVAMELLAEALNLWRGPALIDTGQGALCRMAYVRLSEIKLTAQELRFNVMLKLGLHDSALAELEQLHAQYPLRERLCDQLMTALYLSGRQPDAVAAYHRMRQRLINSMGLEPGHTLQEKFQAVLRQKVIIP